MNPRWLPERPGRVLTALALMLPSLVPVAAMNPAEVPQSPPRDAVMASTAERAALHAWAAAVSAFRRRANPKCA